MKHLTRMLALLLVLALGWTIPAAAYEDSDFYDEEGYARYSGAITVQGYEAPKSFAVTSRVLRGDANGALNWEGKLNRVEAAVMIVRLMGLDGEAEAAASQPSPFTDVPEWANGYVNVAYANGVAKGVGDGRFDPSGACGLPDFLTMLFRLTHLEEGKDWSWATAMDDFQTAVAASDAFHQYPNANWPISRYLRDDAKLIYDHIVWGQRPLTREVAVDVLWLMLNITAGPDNESLGDILVEEYGMSNLLLYDNYVRRTSYGLWGETSVSFTRHAQGGTSTVSVRDGMLYVEAENKLGYEILVTTPAGTEPYTGPIPLPKEDFDGAIGLKVLESLGFDEDGDEQFVSQTISNEFYVFYKDGDWCISKWDLNSGEEDFACIHVVHSPELADYIRSNTYHGLISPEMEALATQLTAGKQTEYEKAEAICTWVATHIYYNWPAAYGYSDNYELEDDEKQISGSVLENRLAICSGYASLTKKLMNAAGLECYYMSDHNHAWNVAFVDGEWIGIDNTWDSVLVFNGPNGPGYICRYNDGGRIWDYRTPDNIMEPNAPVSHIRYFGQDLEMFYGSYAIMRNPVMLTRKNTIVPSAYRD